MFKAMHDHFNVPADYVMPNVLTTPMPLRGFYLGAAVAQLRRQTTMSPERTLRLAELGLFDVTPTQSA